MGECNSDVLLLINTIQSILEIIYWIIPIILIILVSYDIFRIIISKSDDDIKKYRKNLYRRIFYSVIIYLIPTFVFLLMKVVVYDNNHSSVFIKECWLSAK